MKWNKDNLCYSDSEEFKYMNYLYEVYRIANAVKSKISLIDRIERSNIIGCREVDKVNLDEILECLRALDMEMDKKLRLKNK